MTEEMPEALMRKRAMVKAMRTAIRLKHSLLADEELNKLLPEAEKEFDLAWHKGQLGDVMVDIAAIVKRVVHE